MLNDSTPTAVTIQWYGVTSAFVFGNVVATQMPRNPGQWAVYEDEGTHARRMLFGCPRNPGSICGIPIAPATTPQGATWHIDDNHAQPTVTPSINCIGRCKWHGFITRGEFENA